MAYTTIDNPGLFFNTKLYTSTNSELAISGIGFAPNWVWIKSRSDAHDHFIHDTIRGATKNLNSVNTDAEATIAQGLKSFDSDGFTLGTNGNVNESGSETYASWNWLAGTSFSNDASSTSIGSIDSAGSASDASGFSIVSYTGTGSAGTIKHGLSSVPKMIIAKDRDSGSLSWFVGHASLGFTKRLKLDGTNTAADNTVWNNTSPTSSVFSVGDSANANTSGNAIIAYCFAEKQGYLKTGKWTGNGNANGPFSYTGFKPAFILIKRTDVAKNWYINDNLRLGYNVNNPYISPNLTAAETGGTEIDILSNGFKIRAGGTGHNQSGGTYIYMAIAENPFVTSTGIPTTAR
jgi:hypothetical protein